MGDFYVAKRNEITAEIYDEHISEDAAAADDKTTHAKTNKKEEKEKGSVKPETIAKTLAKEPKKASENVKGNRTLKQVTVRVEVNDKEGEDEKVKENDNELNATNDKLDDIIENKTGDGIIDSFISNTKVAN